MSQVVQFSSYSDTYLDTEESAKQHIVDHLKKSKLPFVNLTYEFTTEDNIVYRQNHTIEMIDTVKDNIINVVFSKCTTAEVMQSSDLFLKMVPKVAAADQIIEFKNKKLEEKDLDPTYTQKFGLSLKCDINGRAC